LLAQTRNGMRATRQPAGVRRVSGSLWRSRRARHLRKAARRARFQWRYRDANCSARRLIALDLLTGDQISPRKLLEAIQSAGGKGLTMPEWAARQRIQPSRRRHPRPAPLLRPYVGDFERSTRTRFWRRWPQPSSPTLPGFHSNDALEQTNIGSCAADTCLRRASSTRCRERTRLSKLRTAHSATAGELPEILGYRDARWLRKWKSCSKPSRQPGLSDHRFRFPPSDLEQALAPTSPFNYDYHPTRVSILFGADYWFTSKKGDGRFHRCVPG